MDQQVDTTTDGETGLVFLLKFLDRQVSKISSEIPSLGDI